MFFYGGISKNKRENISEEVIKIFKSKFVRQNNYKDCAVACLLMLMRRYGGNHSIEQLRLMMKIDKNGTNAYNLIETAKKVGFDAYGYKCESIKDIKYPSIAHVIVNQKYQHFIVIDKVDYNKRKIKILDPALGIKQYTFDEFINIWTHVIIYLYPIRKIDNINTKKNIYQTILQIITPYKNKFIVMSILSVIYTILNIISTFYFKIIIEKTTLSARIYFFLFIFFLLISVFKLMIDYIRNKLLIYINKEVDQHLMNYTLNHLLSLSQRYFNSRTTGDVISRLNDLSYVRELISRASVILLIDFVLVVGSIILIKLISTDLFILTVLIFIIYFIVVYIFNNSIKWNIVRNQEAEASVSSLLVETISGIETIKNLRIEEHMYNKVTKEYSVFVNSINQYNKRYNVAKTIKDFVSSNGIIIIIYFGSLLISKGTISSGDFVLFFFFFNFFLEPLKNIFEMEPLLRASSSALWRVSELYNIEKINDNYDSETIKGNIEIKQLSFAYNNLDYVINDFNLSIKNCEKVMIGGPSGCGKSTIAKLLVGELESNVNQIMLDGKDIIDYNPMILRNSICYVSQEETIFTDTLYNNVVMYRDIDEDEVNKVFKIIKIEEIYIKHNLNINMLLEENGSNLSGGERQRIIIARALLKKSNVYIFDESMSEMNTSLERSILNNVLQNYSDKTIIVISHRMDNADLYDKVVMIDNMVTRKKEGVI